MRVVTEFLNRLQVPYNASTVTDFFNTHPHHPSLTSISDLLDAFQVDNAGVAIGRDKFPQIPVPFIARTQSSQGDYCLVVEINNDTIVYLNEENAWITDKLVHFYRQYSGAVLVAEKNAASGEPDYVRNKKQYRQKVILAAVSILLLLTASLWAVWQQKAWQGYVIACFVLTLAGIVVSVLLLIQHFDSNNPLVNRLCSTRTGNGCNNILSSPAAEIIPGYLSWSDVGFLYFSVTWLTLCMVKDTGQSITLVAAMSILALPFTIYSVTYQWLKKAWCRLCLLVLAVLWLQGALALTFYIQAEPQSISLPVWSTVLLITTLIVLAWLWIKPVITRSASVPRLLRDINTFKKDPNIFYTLLQQQRKVSSIAPFASLGVGNDAAGFAITFVSNPFCRPCALMHANMHQLLEKKYGGVHINIIFAASRSADDPKNQVIRRLIAIWQQQGKHVFSQALHTWYTSDFSQYEKWMQQYPVYAEEAQVQMVFDTHLLWCEEHEIAQTPAVFINQHEYLPEYEWSDLDHFIHLASKTAYAHV